MNPAKTSEPSVSDQQRAVEYLDAISHTDFGSDYKRRTFAYLGVRNGSQVLDVGCGAGTDAIALARVTGRQGRVVGVDIDPAMVREAVQRAQRCGPGIEFCVGDAHHLQFEDNTFDACRCDRALQHMPDARSVIEEMVRVLRPGGRLVVSEPDWDTLAIAANCRSITRRVVNFICDHSIRNGWLGRDLLALAREVGLSNIEVRASAWILTDWTLADRLWNLRREAEKACSEGVLSAQEVQSWLVDLQDRAQRGSFVTSITGFVVHGAKSQ